MPENNIDLNTLKEFLEKSQQKLDEIHEISKKVKKYLVWQQVMSVVYILLIAVPLLLGLIYLPGLLNNFTSSFTDPETQGTYNLNNLLQNFEKNN